MAGKAKNVNTNHSEDRMLEGRVRLRQPTDGYRAAIDPVFLAAAVPVKANQRVLDVGCGAGAAALCLLARMRTAEVVGLELQEDLAALAVANAELNGVSERFFVIEGDLRAPPHDLAPESCDHVMANPPYTVKGRGTAPPDEGKARAHVEEADLDVWIDFCLRMVKMKGTVTMIHRAERLDDVIAAFHGEAGISVYPLWPKRGVAAKRVIVQARKGVRTPSRILPGLVLHDGEGNFTPEADAVLRDGAPLEF